MIEQAQPCEGGAGEQVLLGGIDGMGGIAEVARAARFDFDEDEVVGRPVAADKIGFPATFCAEIPMQDFVACAAEMALGNPFPAPPKNVTGMVSRIGTRSGKPGENCGDGLDKAHACEGVRDAAQWHSPCAAQSRNAEIAHQSRASSGRA